MGVVKKLTGKATNIVKKTANPVSLVKESKENWVAFRDTVEVAVVLVVNYFYPGSAMVTSRFVSGGAKKTLGSQLGVIAQMATGIAGANAGNMENYGKLISSGKEAVGNGMSNASEWLNSTKDTMATSNTAGASATNSVSTGAASSGSSTAATQAAVNSGAPASGASAGSATADAINATQSGNAAVTAENTFAVPGSGAQAPYAAPTSAPAAAAQAGGGSGGGIMSGMGEWVEKNPVPALMAGNMAISGVGGMMQAGGAEKQAEAQRDIEMRRIDAQQARGGWGANTTAVTVNDPTQIVDNMGRYVYGPMAGQYAPERTGLINRRY